MKQSGGALLSMLNLDRLSKTTLTRQLENNIRKAVLDGKLPAATRMPSSRQLAVDLGVSRITIKNAFEQLTSEGFLETQYGSGTYVAQLSTGDLPVIATSSRRRTHTPKTSPISPHVERIQQSLATTRLSQVRAFRPGIPALDVFPRRAWAEVYSRAIRHHDSYLLGYGPSSGLDELKAAIARHVFDSRGIECQPDQIIITSGAQQAFSLILLTLLTPGNTIWMEDPGHIAFRDAAKFQGLQIDPVPLDAEGFSLSYARANYVPCSLMFVTPSHQHPLGMTMSLTRRLDLLELAQSQESWVIEDDYDSEFHYEERPQPALKALDKHGRVLYVGSFSKSMFPAMRLGYLICPLELGPAFAAAQTLLSQNVSLLQQKAMTYFMEDGSFNAHLRRMKLVYKKRRDILVHALEEHACSLLRPEPCRAGMHLVTLFSDSSVRDHEIAKRLWNAGIDCLPLSIFRDQAVVAPGLLLGFACAPEDQISGKIRQAVQVMGANAL
ncbi:MAG: PLP-dependent aminotransferase family protein [Rhodobacteraceae bacterium]|nr:PLP-dependent aminotransferase family protein [Paracoccaceae bacterium]